MRSQYSMLRAGLQTSSLTIRRQMLRALCLALVPHAHMPHPELLCRPLQGRHAFLIRTVVVQLEGLQSQAICQKRLEITSN